MCFSENFIYLVALNRTNLFRAGKECVCCEYTFAEAVPGLFTSEGVSGINSMCSFCIAGPCIISNMCALETIDKGFSWHGGSKEMFDKCIAESMKLQPRTTLHDQL